MSTGVHREPGRPESPPGRHRLADMHGMLVFGCLLIALLWVPVPLGSNRPVAWFAWETGVYGLLAFWTLGLLLGGGRAGYSRSSARILAVFSVWLAMVFLQSLSIPGSLVAALNPVVHALQVNLGLISVAATSTLSVDPGNSYNEFLKYGSYVAVFGLVLATVTTRKRMLAAVAVVIAAGVVESLFGTFAYFVDYVIFPESGAGTGLRMGTFANGNHFANLLAMSLGVTLGMLTAVVNSQAEGRGLSFTAYTRSGKAFTLLLLAAAAVLAAGLVVSGSRPPFVFLTVSFAVIMATSWSRGSSRTGELALLPLMIAGVLVVIVSMALDGAFTRLLDAGLVDSERVLQNARGLNLLSVVWIAGVGAGNYQWMFPMFRGDDLRFVTYDYAHNDYLQTAIEQGIPIAAVLGLAVLLMLRELRRGYRQRRNPLIRGVILGCLMSTGFMLLHALIEFNFRIPANAAYFFAIAGIGIAACRIERGVRRSDGGAGNSGVSE